MLYVKCILIKKMDFLNLKVTTNSVEKEEGIKKKKRNKYRNTFKVEQDMKVGTSFFCQVWKN